MSRRVPPSEERMSPEEIERIQQRMRFEDRAVMTIVIALPLGAAAFLAAYFGGLRNLTTPIILLTIAVGFVASISWFVGNLRTEKAVARVESERRPRLALWRYLVPIGVALAFGAVYLVIPQYDRWLWYLFFTIGVIVFAWREVRRRRQGSRQ